MKKSTLIIIGIVYFASIVFVSIFGLRAVVFDPIFPVEKIEILDEIKGDWTIQEQQDGSSLIKIQFTKPGKLEGKSATGTYVQLVWRILPDNATNKKVSLSYKKDLSSVEFIKDDDGEELGLILIGSKVYFSVQIRAVDGSGKTYNVTIWAY